MNWVILLQVKAVFVLAHWCLSPTIPNPPHDVLLINVVKLRYHHSWSFSQHTDVNILLRCGRGSMFHSYVPYASHFCYVSSQRINWILNLFVCHPSVSLQLPLFPIIQDAACAFNPPLYSTRNPCASTSALSFAIKWHQSFLRLCLFIVPAKLKEDIKKTLDWMVFVAPHLARFPPLKFSSYFQLLRLVRNLVRDVHELQMGNEDEE